MEWTDQIATINKKASHKARLFFLSDLQSSDYIIPPPMPPMPPISGIGAAGAAGSG